MAKGITEAYALGRHGVRCCATGRAIEPGQEIVSVLAEDADGALHRLDYLPESWTPESRPGDELHVIGFWRGVAREPAPRPQRLDDAALLDLFESLEEASEPRRVAFRYVLALQLVRRRLLVLEGTSEGGIRVRRRTPARGALAQPSIEVKDPGMDEQAVSEVIEQLSALIDRPAGSGP